MILSVLIETTALNIILIGETTGKQKFLKITDQRSNEIQNNFLTTKKKEVCIPSMK